MSEVVVVDWLGRGGIAQVTSAWVIELQALGHHVTVVTRAGRELALDGAGAVLEAGNSLHPVLAHRAVARRAARAIRELRPDVVLIQNYVLPALEGAVYRAAEAVDARLLVSIHDHRLHSRVAGTHRGLARHLRAAEGVIVHSEYVGRSLAVSGQFPPITVLPLPLPPAMVDAVTERPAAPDGPPFTAIHFGVVKRGYKGTDVVVAVAAQGVPNWDFTICGAGAPRAPGVRSINGYLESQRLRAEVQRSRACLLPYRWATQSAVVTLAQALGSIPIATRVGGLPEQITDGENGLLLPAGAPVEAWIGALRRLSDSEAAATMSAEGMAHARRLHRQFGHGVEALVGGPATVRVGGAISPDTGRAWGRSPIV